MSPILRFFTYKHLPEHLQKVSKPIGELAEKIDAEIPDGPEKSAGLRKLLEAKDCLVRAALPMLALFVLAGCASDRTCADVAASAKVINAAAESLPDSPQTKAIRSNAQAIARAVGHELVTP
jgi:hypothetical protein